MAQKINGLFPGELLPTTTVGGCIDIFEKVWPNPIETIAMVEEEIKTPDFGLTWKRAQTVGNNASYKRTNFNLEITENALLGSQACQNISNQYYLLLLASTIPYAVKHDIEELHQEGYSMLKYSTGQEYKAHSDGGTGMGRAVSSIVYLNDDYEGGEVEFVNFGLKIKPQAGMMLLFPSTYPYAHIAHPVTSGTKYSLVTWVHDRAI